MNSSQRKYLNEIINHPFPTMGFAPMLEDFVDQTKSLAKSLKSTGDITEDEYAEIVLTANKVKSSWDTKPILRILNKL